MRASGLLFIYRSRFFQILYLIVLLLLCYTTRSLHLVWYRDTFFSGYSALMSHSSFSVAIQADGILKQSSSLSLSPSPHPHPPSHNFKGLPNRHIPSVLYHLTVCTVSVLAHHFIRNFKTIHPYEVIHLRHFQSCYYV